MNPLYSGTITLLHLNMKFILMNFSLLFALFVVSMHCCENLRLDMILLPRFLAHGVRLSFTPHISQFLAHLNGHGDGFTEHVDDRRKKRGGINKGVMAMCKERD